MTTNTATQKPPPPAAPRQFTIPRKLAVSVGKVVQAIFIFIFGVDGIGKSTFAANAPDTLFLDIEGSTDEMNVRRYPDPKDRAAFKWADLLAAVRSLIVDPQGYKHLALDTVDAIEALIFDHVCEKAGAPNVGEIPYGRGYDAALEEWRLLIAALEQLQQRHGVGIILLGHAHLKTFKNPQGDDFDRYIVKMHEKSAAFLRERARGVYFANYETFADKDKKTKRVRGVSTGARLLYTQRTAAYDAKDRYGLPEQLALDWNEFERLRAAGAVASEALRAEIERKAKEIGGDVEKAALEYLAKNADNAVQLALLNTKLNAKLAEKAELAAATAPTEAAAAQA